ncbi:chloride channel [Obelidium mucronatum]|nr:chloride channel [Obelidium mucronatum]
MIPPPPPPPTPVPDSHAAHRVATPLSAFARLRDGLLGGSVGAADAAAAADAEPFFSLRPPAAAASAGPLAQLIAAAQSRAGAGAHAHAHPLAAHRVRVSNPFTFAAASPTDWNAFSDRRVGYDDFTTIDWLHDEAKDRVRAQDLKRWKGWRGQLVRAFDGIQAWIVVLLIGVSMGLCAGVIDIASIWLNDVKEGYCEAGFYLSKKFCCWHRPETDYTCVEWIPWTKSSFLQCIIYTFYCVLFSVLAAILVKFYAPYAAGEGIPEIKTILGGFVIKKFLGVWTLLVKIIGITLTVGAGLSLGKEGPLVHIACCFGNIIPRIFPKYRDNEAKKRHLLSASSAAGISVAFGAPVGGVLFALEEVSYYFPYKTMWRSFFCAMVGAIVLRVMNPFRTGKLVWFEVKLSRRWHLFELPAFILLGCMGGLFGAFFIRMNTIVTLYRKKYWNDKPILEVAIVALVTGLVGFAHVYLRVSTVDLVANLFRECADIDGDFHGMCTNAGSQVIFLLLFAAWIKFMLTVFTFGTKIPAGIFTPSIAIGALIGRALGILVSTIQKAYPQDPYFTACTIKPITNPCITPATYSILGAAAFLAGTTRITMSLTVIMFELTGALSYVLPVMVTVLTAKWVADYTGGDGGAGLYGELIRQGGYPFIDLGDEYIGTGSVSDIMTPVSELKVVPGCGWRVGDLEAVLKGTRYKGFPVVVGNGDFNVVGFAGREELRYAVATAKARENGAGEEAVLNFVTAGVAEGVDIVDMRQWINPTPMTFAVDYPISLCVEFFKKMGVRYVLVTEKESGVLAGIVTKKDLLRHGKQCWGFFCVIV